MRRLLWISGFALLNACGPKDHPGPSRDAKTTRITEDETSAPSARSAERPPSENPAPLALKLHAEVRGDAVGLSVINAGPQATSLAREVVLERRTAQGFQVVNKQALALTFDCKSAGCVTIAKGAELLAPAWLGLADGERCGALIAKQPPGEYRLKVSSCDHSSASEVTFTWPTL